MLLQYSLVALCLAPLSTAIRFQGRGSADHTAAPYFNITTNVESAIATATAAPAVSLSSYYIAGTASSSGHQDPRPTGTGLVVGSNVQNSTRSNASCTVHIPGANIKSWFPVTFLQPIATITNKWGNYSHSRTYTFVPHTTTFNAASALETEALCTYGWNTYTDWDWTAWECLPYTEKPTAASTATVFRSAVPPVPAGNTMYQYDVWEYDIALTELPSPTTAISVAPNSTAVETMPTAYVEITAYEVERGNSTETVQLSSVYLQSYGEGIGNSAAATGSVPAGFLEQIPQSTCVGGNLQAVVTVLIFVEMFYLHYAHFEPGDVHWESSALGWEVEAPWGVADPTSTYLLPTVADWDLSGTTAPAEVEFTKAGSPVTARPGVVDGSNKQTKPPPTRTVGNVGTAPVVVGPSSVVVVGSQTLIPGGPAVTVGGTPVALAPSGGAIVVGGTSLPLPQHQHPGHQQTVGSLGTVPVVVGPSSIVVVGTHTLRPGGAPVVIAPGTTVSLAPSGAALVVGATTSLLPQNPGPAPPVLTIGSTTFVPNAATQFLVAPGQTLTPGGTAVVDGVEVSLDASAAFVVVGSSTQILSSPSHVAGEFHNELPELEFGGSTFTALPTGSILDNSPGSSPGENTPHRNQDIQNGQAGNGPTFVISGQTLAPGGAAITVSGSTLSLAPSGAYLVIDGSTTTLATPPAAAPHTTPPPLTIGNGVFKPLPGPGTAYLIGTARLTPGGTVTVDGTTIALAPGATALVVNGATSLLAAHPHPQFVTEAPLLTIGSQTYTAAPGTVYRIGGQTLTPGGTVTVDGTTIVLAPQATQLVYGSAGQSTTVTLFPATVTGTRDVSPTTTAVEASERERGGGGGGAAPTSSRGGAAGGRGSAAATAAAALLGVGVGWWVVGV